MLWHGFTIKVVEKFPRYSFDTMSMMQRSNNCQTTTILYTKCTYIHTYIRFISVKLLSFIYPISYLLLFINVHRKSSHWLISTKYILLHSVEANFDHQVLELGDMSNGIGDYKLNNNHATIDVHMYVFYLCFQWPGHCHSLFCVLLNNTTEHYIL